MTRHFCTYFDSRYLPQGLAMLHSLARQCPDMRCLVWALDEGARDVASDHAPPGCWFYLLPMTGAENIWRLTPDIVLDAYGVGWPEVAYIDADLYWFDSPEALYAEAGDAPTAVIPHRWTPRHAERLRINGIFNVGWTWFNGCVGREFAEQWRWQCRHWQPTQWWSRFMDQPFLDHWPNLGAAVITNPGANLAPYNQEQYAEPFPVIFYHFHEWRSPQQRTGYPLQPWVVEQCYEPYEREVAKWATLTA